MFLSLISPAGVVRPIILPSREQQSEIFEVSVFRDRQGHGFESRAGHFQILKIYIIPAHLFFMVNRIAVIQTTLGTMELELFEDKAPITTKNFIDLAKKGFYDGLIFHRIIKDFMIQGGCPKGEGTGGPGYSIPDEFHPDLKHDNKGILSMANSGPNSGGSQFFITLVPCQWLDNKHAVFGKVIVGKKVLMNIGRAQTDHADKPVEPVVMKKVWIKEE